MFGPKPITIESLIAELAQAGQKYPPTQPGAQPASPQERPTSIYGMLTGQQKPGGLIGAGRGKGGAG